MRKLMLLAIPVAFSFVAAGADPAGFHIWKAGDLKTIEKGMPAKMDAQKITTESLAKGDNHAFSMSHREGPGIAEFHAKVADIFVVQSGEATLVVGGTMPGEKTTAPGEKRAPMVQGGAKHKLVAGDIVSIPAATPHQLLLDPGAKFTYFVIKVDAK